jgi:hypothetical protein
LPRLRPCTLLLTQDGPLGLLCALTELPCLLRALEAAAAFFGSNSNSVRVWPYFHPATRLLFWGLHLHHGSNFKPPPPPCDQCLATSQTLTQLESALATHPRVTSCSVRPLASQPPTLALSHPHDPTSLASIRSSARSPFLSSRHPLNSPQHGRTRPHRLPAPDPLEVCCCPQVSAPHGFS